MMMKSIPLKTWHKLHKWIFVINGALILMWLITGIVMTSASFFPEPALTSNTAAPPDFRHITMSPADATRRLESILGQPVEIRSVGLRQMRDMLAYHITLQNGESHLINAQSGDEFKITPELAEQIARDDFPAQAPILRTEWLDHHEYGYYFGPLPVYRIVFGDNRSTYSDVSIASGEVVSRNDRWSRIRGVFEALHSFNLLRIISGRNRIVTGLLWLVSIIAISGALVGYYLALPSRWRVF